MAPRTRVRPPGEALALLEDELARHGLRAVTQAAGGSRAAVVRCRLEDRRTGRTVADRSGYGPGLQAAASASFEAWQWYRIRAGLGEAAADPQRMRLMSPAGILAQEPLAGEDGPLWYPAFPVCPWLAVDPVPGDGGYGPYLRYATGTGTAAGTDPGEALLAAATEAAEGDAVSLALLDWHVRGEPPRRVHRGDLPAPLRDLMAEAETLAGDVVLLFDITAGDLTVPAFLALPAAGAGPGIWGEGAALSPALAAERALGELMQACRTRDDAYATMLTARIAAAARWPVIGKCARMDPRDLAARAVRAPARGPRWWDDPSLAGLGVAGQLSRLAGLLRAAGFRAWQFQWNPGEPVPVTTAVIPGLETFFLAAQGVPVLPGTRGESRTGPARAAAAGSSPAGP